MDHDHRISRRDLVPDTNDTTERADDKGAGGPDDADHEPPDDENTSEGRSDPTHPFEVQRDRSGKPVADRRG